MELFTKTFSCTTFYGGKTLVFGPILPFQLFVGPISTKSWAQLFVEPAVNKKLKVGRAGGWRAAVERVEWQSDRFRWKFLSDLFICLFEIFGIVEATYSENMKPICRFNQLCKFEAVYFSAYLFSIWTVRRGSFFHTFPIKISFDYIYLIKHLLDLKTLDTA